MVPNNVSQDSHTQLTIYTIHAEVVNSNQACCGNDIVTLI